MSEWTDSGRTFTSLQCHLLNVFVCVFCAIYFRRISTSRTTHQTTKRIYTDATDYVSSKLTKREDATIAGDSILQTAGVIDPRTGRVLTVGEAIQMRILDVRTGEIVLYAPNGDEIERISLHEAINRKLIDATLANNLLQPGAAYLAGRPISLLEVIQKEIFDAENGYDATGTRIKVIPTTKQSSPEANSRGRRSNSTNDRDDDGEQQVGGATISIIDATALGVVDPKTGLYQTRSGQMITINEAVRHGHLVQTETIKIKTNELCLSDAIVHGLVDTSGWVTDRNTGAKFRLDSAIEKGLITPDVREVVDARNDMRITLQQALDAGILNAKTGRYFQNVTKEKLTFIEAKNRQLIGKPMTLKDVCDLNMLDNNGMIMSLTRKNKLSILEAIHAGMLDSDDIKSITKTKNERITLADALSEEIILSNSVYRDVTTHEEMSIPEAVDRGLISSVSQRSIFNIDGFKNPHSGDFVSLNTALTKNIVCKKDGEYQLDTGKQQWTKLMPAVDSGIVRPEVHEMLSRPIGVHDANGKELTVLELVYHNLIDPKSGYLLHPQTGTIVPLDTAIETKLITPEGALLLSSLLNITLTTETVTKTIHRYVTITSDQSLDQSLTFSEAVRLGYIDENHQLYTHPDDGQTYSIQQALNHGFIVPDTDSPDIPVPTKRSTITIVHKSLQPEQAQQSMQQQMIERTYTQRAERSSNDVKGITNNFLSAERQTIPQITKQMFDIPPKGWLLSSAIELKLFDPNTGLFQIFATDRQVSFEECIKLEIINPLSVSVMDPANNCKMTVLRSLERRVLDPLGNYKNRHNKVIGMRQAIDQGLIVLENLKPDPDSPARIIQVVHQPGKPAVLELADKHSTIASKTVTTIVQSKSSSQDIPSPEPVQLAPGIIYDPSTALVIFTESGKSENIISAVTNGTVDGSAVCIVDPNTGAQLSIQEAIERGIVDKQSGAVKSSNGQLIDIINAAKLGLLTVVGAPLIAAAEAIDSIKYVFDPSTGQQIPYEVAYQRGLVSKEELIAVYPDSPSHNRIIEVDSIRLSDETPKVRIASEPKYSVSIGRAQSLPSAEGKPVILQKMRKKIHTPKDALARGIIDQATTDLLDNVDTFRAADGAIQTLGEAISRNKLNGQSGKIIDPQRNDTLNVNEAIERGILDADGTNQILVPLNRSLSIGQLKTQGLIDVDSLKIIHPETATQLSLREAIICDIVDPLSAIRSVRNQQQITLRTAIDDGVIDSDRSLIRTHTGNVDLMSAINDGVFPQIHNESSLQLLGMTFPVAVQRNLIDTTTKEFIHPITGDRMSIAQAIGDDLIMVLPYTPNTDGVHLDDALNTNLIDSKAVAMKHPKTNELIPLKEAVESGLLIVKPLPELIALHASGPITSVTETVTSYHTITTKTLQLRSGYALISPDQVQNVHTGEIVTVEEAKLHGLIKDESNVSEQFATREIMVSFSEAIRRGLVDIKAGTYTDPASGTVMTIREAVRDGILSADDDEPDVSTTVVDTKHIESTKGTTEVAESSGSTGSKIKKTAKLGLMAVVGAPVLAGMAIADGVKRLSKKKDKKEKPVPHERTVITHEPPQPSKVVVEQPPIPKRASIAIVSKTIVVSPEVEERTLSPPSEKRVTFDVNVVSTDSDTVHVPDIVVTPDVEQRTLITDTVTIVSTQKSKYAELVDYEERPDSPQSGPLRIDENLRPDDLAKYGAFDIDSGMFLNPDTLEPVPFHVFVNDMNIFDPNNFYVKDLNEDMYEPFDVALEKPLIDKNTGHMVDSKNGNRVPFFECTRRRWILDQIPEESEEDEADVDTDVPTKNMTVVELLQPKENVEEILESKTVADAIQTGTIRIERLVIKDPATDEILPMDLAVDRGLVDLSKGVVVNTVTKQEIQFSSALERGLLFAGKQPPISLEAVVRQGLYDPVKETLTDLNRTDEYDIRTAIDKGIIHADISLIKNVANEEILPLDDALNKQLVLYTGKVKGNNGELVPLNDAFDQGLILTKPIRWDLLEALIKQYYYPSTGRLLSPITGEQLTLRESIQSGWVDVSNVLVRDDETDNIVTVTDAIESGLVDADRGLITRPELPLDDALHKGYLISADKPYSLVDLIIRHLYDPMTGLLNVDGVQVTVEDALKNGLVHTKDMIVKDPRNGEIITLLEAIRRGIVDPRAGIAIDPRSGLKLTLIEAYERGILLQSKRKSTLPDAVFKGIYDPRTGKFSTSVGPERMSGDRAIRRGIIDAQSTIVNARGTVLPFELAVESGVVDIRRGTVVDDNGDKIDFREAFDRGILIEVKKPISLSGTIAKGLYDEETGLFMDPKSGKRLTISQSLARNLIADSVQMKEENTGLYKAISLVDAAKSGVIDGQNAEVYYNHNRLTLKEAFDVGVLCDVNAPVSLQRAIHQGLYDSQTGKIHDNKSGRQITLLEAMRKYIVNPQLPCFFDENEEKLYSLADTCRNRLIDRREGVFKEPFSDVFIPLNEAMSLGLIVDIENCSFGLYETISMGLYDRRLKQIVHPVNNRKLTLRQACAEDVVSPIASLIKDTTTNKYLKLSEAIESNLIDSDEGTYKLPNYAIDLYEARKRGLIVSNQKLLSIEKAIQMHLFRAESGKFVDATNNTFHTLPESFDNGLIDAETTVYKDPLSGRTKSLRQAIADGDIDIERAKVLDPKAKLSYNYDAALQKGLLVTISRPLTGRQTSKHLKYVDSPVSPKSSLPREMTVQDAITYEIINTETSVVKDPTTSKFKALKHFMSTVNAEWRAVIDPKSLFIAFDPTFVVYNREPLSFDYAVESKKLNLSTGMFVDTHDTNKEYALKDAVALGLIDPESALVKDGAKHKLVRLPEALRKGLVDADQANVLDTVTSKLHPLQVAYDTGLLITPKRSFGLLDAIAYKLYNPTTGCLSDPFISTSVIERKRYTLNDAIVSGLVDPTTTVVSDTTNRTIVPLVAAIALNLIDPIAGRLNKSDSESIDLVIAQEKGYLLPAEQRVSSHYHRVTKCSTFIIDYSLYFILILKFCFLS